MNYGRGNKMEHRFVICAIGGMGGFGARSLLKKPGHLSHGTVGRKKLTSDTKGQSPNKLVALMALQILSDLSLWRT